MNEQTRDHRGKQWDCKEEASAGANSKRRMLTSRERTNGEKHPSSPPPKIGRGVLIRVRIYSNLKSV